MKLFESFKKIFVAPEELYEEELEVEEEPRNEPVRSEPRKTQQHTEIRRPTQNNESGSTITAIDRKSRVVSMYGDSNLKISVERPKQYDEVRKIADKIKDGYTIILNTEDVDDALKQRLGDFMAGAAYVRDGDMSSAAEGVYVISPKNVKVDGDFLNSIGSMSSNYI